MAKIQSVTCNARMSYFNFFVDPPPQHIFNFSFHSAPLRISNGIALSSRTICMWSTAYWPTLFSKRKTTQNICITFGEESIYVFGPKCYVFSGPPILLVTSKVLCNEEVNLPLPWPRNLKNPPHSLACVNMSIDLWLSSRKASHPGKWTTLKKTLKECMKKWPYHQWLGQPSTQLILHVLGYRKFDRRFSLFI